MKLVIATLALAVLGAGCQKEVVVRKSSLANQLAELNKQGWSVGFADSASDPNARKPKLEDPNVRVVKGADFSSLKFNTNFQIDDPKLRAQYQQQHQEQNPQQNTAPSGLTPFGPAPMVPR